MESSNGRRAPGPTRPFSKRRRAAVSGMSLAPFLKCKDSECPLVHRRAHLEELLALGKIDYGVAFACSLVRTSDQKKQGHPEHYMVLMENKGLRVATAGERRDTKGLTNRREVGSSPSAKFSRSDLARSSESARMPRDQSLEDVTSLAKGGLGSQDPTMSMPQGLATVDHLDVTKSAQNDSVIQGRIAEQGDLVQRLIRRRYKIGSYRLLEAVGQGNSGIVVKVANEEEDPEEGNLYAMKFTWGTMVEGPKGDPDRFRVLRAYHIMDLLKSHHASRVFELLQHASLGIITVEQLLIGQTLKEMQEGMDIPFSLTDVKQIATALCVVLEEAHSLGFVHRDIKPDNIMWLEDGRIVLVDWGIARSNQDVQRDNRSILPDEYSVMSGAQSEGTADNEVIGTPRYMAPEQLDGGAINAQTDVYQLGATLYHLLTGRMPCAGVGMSEILENIVKKPPVSASIFLPADEEHQAFSDLLDDMLEKEPSRRPQGVYEVMRRLSGKSPELSTMVQNPRKPQTWINTVLLLACFIVLVLILLSR